MYFLLEKIKIDDDDDIADTVCCVFKILLPPPHEWAIGNMCYAWLTEEVTYLSIPYTCILFAGKCY
jgi:hypothetical protein